jgi:hypothetical protein
VVFVGFFFLFLIGLIDQLVKWAYNFFGGFGVYVRINHGCFYTAMPQQLLYVSQIGAIFQYMGGKRVSQGMWCGLFVQLFYALETICWPISIQQFCCALAPHRMQ